MIRSLEHADPGFHTQTAEDVQHDLTAVYVLAERCRYEADHAHHVAHLALTLFDELTPLHHLGDFDRHLLHVACLLHDIGHVASKRGHHKRSMHLILNEEDLPFGRTDRTVVACVARYHRKAPPKKRHDLYAAMDAVNRHRVRLLAGFLRIADALDKGHISVVADLTTALTDRTLQIDCQVTQTELAEKLILPVTKANLLEDTLDREIQFAFHDH